MQWSKYRRFLRRNPNEALWIQQYIGSPMLISAPLNYPAAKAEAMLKSHVTAKLRYIAFRDFATLDLNAGNYNKLGKYTFPGKSTVGLEFQISYTVRFHVVGVDKPGDRMIYVDNEDYQGECEKHVTIREAIDSRIKWHQEGWAIKGKALRFDAVVKSTKSWIQIDKYSWNCTDEMLDLYRFPDSYHYPALTKEQVEADLETAEDRAAFAQQM